MPELWIPGAAEPSLDDFVTRVHKQIGQYTASHAAEQSEVQIELADGGRLSVQALSAEPGYGFVTLAVHRNDGGGPEQVIVPVNAIRRIDLGPAEADRARFGFALPDDGTNERGAEPAA
ncbi:MAG: hypothetical protein E6G50_00825 [Actinobacteria bacterium]|nr:MAG: hypothetical protein E6G50_00825 [Actinomycetota bacterium]